MSLYSHDLDTATAVRREIDFASLVAALSAAQAASPTARCAAAIGTRAPAATPRREAVIGLLSSRPGWASFAELLGHSFDIGTASMLSATSQKGL